MVGVFQNRTFEIFACHVKTEKSGYFSNEFVKATVLSKIVLFNRS